MPKESVKKLGDPKFDKKQKPLDLLIPLDERDEKLNLELEFLAKCKKLTELAEHFEIDLKDEHAWFHLAFSLADHYVPGMDFEKKRGQPKKWNFLTLSALCSLYELTKDKFPEKNRAEVFKILPQEAQNTALSVIIPLGTEGGTLESAYDRFKSEIGYQVFLYHLEKTELSRDSAYKNLLNNKRKKLYEAFKKHPEQAEAYLMHLMQKIADE